MRLGCYAAVSYTHLTVGSDVITAYYRMESLELWAKITITAIILGGSYDIDRKNIATVSYTHLKRHANLAGFFLRGKLV